MCSRSQDHRSIRGLYLGITKMTLEYLMFAKPITELFVLFIVLFQVENSNIQQECKLS